jgi:hypothetical protein
MLKRLCAAAAMSTLLAGACFAQEAAESGLSMPVTASFGLMDTQRFTFSNQSASPVAANFRLMFYPTLRLGKHWFAYAAIQVRRLPYFYYDAYLADRGVETDLVQGYVGYTVHPGAATIVFKAGQMTSAFGSFPLRYDDVQNPLMDQPLAYITEVPLRSDQILCGTPDLLNQHYGSVAAGCGGEVGRGPGLTPVTLYGMPAVQAEISAHHFDGRVQLTNSSPAYPWSFETVSRQYLQATVGGGLTVRQGFRLGGSYFRGPYLENSLSAWLPSGTTVRSFPAIGKGIDVEWARGRFSTNSELQQIRFEMPNFVIPPRILSGYLEVKGRLTPRIYGAVREGFLKTQSVLDTQGVSASAFAPTLQTTEFGVGYWLHPHVLAKVSYEIAHAAGSDSTRSNVFGLQLVATFNQLQWAWK